jgi:hypothetical protein
VGSAETKGTGSGMLVYTEEGESSEPGLNFVFGEKDSKLGEKREGGGDENFQLNFGKPHVKHAVQCRF